MMLKMNVIFNADIHIITILYGRIEATMAQYYISQLTALSNRGFFMNSEKKYVFKICTDNNQNKF